MKRTRTRLVLGLVAIVTTGLMAASGAAGAAPSGPTSSVYCDYLGHVPSVSDR